MRRPLLLCLFATFAMAMPAAAADFDFAASSYLGEAGFDDAITGACVQADGTIVLAGNLGPAVRKKIRATGTGAGCVVRITADAQGRVYIVGRAAAGLPLSMNPTGGDYTGGGFLLVMSADLEQRLLCTRTCDGRGAPHAVDVRAIDGRTRAVFGGSGMSDGMFVRKAIQENPGDASGEKDGPKNAFFAVVQGRWACSKTRSTN